MTARVLQAGLCVALGLGVVSAGEVVVEGPFREPLAPWRAYRVHDTASDRVEVEEGRLRLSLDTLGTDDATVKLRGVRLERALRIEDGGGYRISCQLDWNQPRNGSYLTAGIALVGSACEVAPHQAGEALAFEFVGVPPGKNARPFLWRRAAGGLRPLYTEGWPQPRREDRVGRAVGRVEIELLVDADQVVLLEDGQERYRGPGGIAGDLRLLLFVTSHSNYPERTVYFDRVRVERLR